MNSSILSRNKNSSRSSRKGDEQTKFAADARREMPSSERKEIKVVTAAAAHPVRNEVQTVIVMSAAKIGIGITNNRIRQLKATSAPNRPPCHPINSAAGRVANREPASERSEQETTPAYSSRITSEKPARRSKRLAIRIANGT